MSYPRQAAVVLTLAALSLAIAPIARAENPDHIRQLLATKQCQRCDLSGAGLVRVQLPAANLQQSDFSRANLSQGNFASANLSGARLAGSSLAGANLSGADLTGADLRNADLRGAILTGAILDNADLTGAAVMGTIDLPQTVGSAEMFYQWGMEAAQQKRYEKAIEQFTQATARDPLHAPSFLGRSISRFESGDRKGAIGDVEMAQSLFKSQGNTARAEQTEKIAIEMKKPEVTSGGRGGNGLGMGLMNILGGLLKIFAL